MCVIVCKNGCSKTCFFTCNCLYFLRNKRARYQNSIVVYSNTDTFLQPLEHDANKQAERIEGRVVVQLPKARSVNQPFRILDAHF